MAKPKKSKDSEKPDHWNSLNAHIAIILLVVGIIGVDVAYQNHNYDIIMYELSSIKSDVKDMRTEIDYIGNSVSQPNGIYPHGNYSSGDLINRTIKITYPENGSQIKEDIHIGGIANFDEKDYIYIISKLGGKYWVATDCSKRKSTGNWEGTRPCIFPNYYGDDQKTFETFAIITDRFYKIGDCFFKEPLNLARSDTIYIKNHDLE